jgi:hypothetical protein
VWLYCEACNVAIFLHLLSTRVFDRRNLTVFAKTAAACVVVLIVHELLPSSPLALAADALLYVGMVVGTRAIRIEEVAQFCRLAFQRTQ